ncbi:MAG: DegT/DnrJ/EryC1/StrS family aminotransferase, partial [Elusimicrobiota bacterium]
GGQFVLGEDVAAFERGLAAVCGTKYAIGLNSGTDALILALRVLGVGPGDEVITATNSFVASASAVALVGAKPVLVDVRDDYNMDPAAVAKAVNARTKAIMPVHLTGNPADMDPLREIAKKHKLFIVEDSAQAIMAEYKGRPTGSLGDIGCFSLHPLKTLNACGDGGAMTTDDPELDKKSRLLRNIGLKTREECVIWSGNSRLDTMQAAILLVKLKHLAAWTQARRQNAHFYDEHLGAVAGLKIPQVGPGAKPAYHTYIVRVQRREALREHLKSAGIDTAIHYPIPIHLQPIGMSLGYKKGDFPMAERQAQEILSLPVYQELTQDDIGYIVEKIKEFYSK